VRKAFPKVVEDGREQHGPPYASLPGERHGRFRVRHPKSGQIFCAVVSAGEGWKEAGLPGEPWEHVSVSNVSQGRCPTWEEMCWFKSLFFEEEEWVVQYHPPASLYVNNHPHVLHLWRPVESAFPTPPQSCV
jgi:hypothetical protein